MECNRYASILLLLFALPAAAQDQRHSELCANGRWHEQGHCPAVLSSPAWSDQTDTSVTISYSVDRSGVLTYVCCGPIAPESASQITQCLGSGATDEVDAPGSRGVLVQALQPDSSYECALVAYQPVPQKEGPEGEEEFPIDPVGWASNIIATTPFTTDPFDPGNGGGGDGDVLFSDDFDSHAEMNLSGRCKYHGDTECSSASLPSNWDFLYTAHQNPTNPACAIREEADRQGGGKGFVVWDESAGSGSSWATNDCQLMKYFAGPIATADQNEDPQYPEVWFTWWQKFLPTSPGAIDALNASKLTRIGHYNPCVVNGSAGTSVFNTSNNSTVNGGCGKTGGGILLYDIKKNGTAGYWHKMLETGNPSHSSDPIPRAQGFRWRHADGSEYSNQESAWANVYGDGQWHFYEVRAVMNTPGVANGIAQMYLDGVLQGSFTNIEWLNGTPTHPITGFNAITIGGNSDWIWDGQSNAEIKYYYIDDVKVCTTREACQP